MNNLDLIKQLEDLKFHCQEFAEDEVDEDIQPFTNDVKALDRAIYIIKISDTLANAHSVIEKNIPYLKFEEDQYTAEHLLRKLTIIFSNGHNINDTVPFVSTSFKWNTIKEKPFRDGWYLVTKKETGENKDKWCQVAQFKDGEWKSVFEIIAWMPLPAPFEKYLQET